MSLVTRGPGFVLDEVAPPSRATDAETALLSLSLYRPSTWSVLEAEGEMDTQCVATLRALLAKAGCNVVVDLREVTFVDASGLGVLATGGHRARRLGGAVRLVGPSPQVRRLLVLTRLDEVLPIFGTMREALAEPDLARRPVPWRARGTDVVG